MGVKANQCDLRCPQIVAKQAEFRLGASSHDLGAIVAGPFKGLRALGRAATCPHRNLSEDEWRPRPECETGAAEIVVEHDMRPGQLTLHERGILGHYIQRPPLQDSLPTD